MNFVAAFPLDNNWNGDRVTEITPPFSEDEPVCWLQGFLDRLGRKWSLEDKLRFLAEGCRSLWVVVADAERHCRPVRGGKMHLVQNASRLPSQLEIDNNGVKFAALQQEACACRVLTCIW